MKNLKVSMKLIVSFSIVIVFAIIVGAAGIIGMSQINAADDTLYRNNVVAISQMGEIRDELQRQRNITRDYVLHAGNSDDLQTYQQNMKASEAEMVTFFAAYEGTITDKSAESAYFEAKQLYENDYNTLKQNLLSLSHTDVDAAETLLYDSSSSQLINTMVNAFTASMDNNNTWAKEQVDANTDLFYTMAIIEVVALVVAVAIAMYLAIHIARMISIPLSALTNFMKKASATGDINLSEESVKEIQVFSQARDEVGQCIGATAGFINRLHNIGNALQSVADGDLTAELSLLSQQDTMGLALNKMMDNLNNMFGEINNATSQVATGSKQIADGSQALAQGSTEQAAAVEQLSSSISEIAVKTKDNAEMAGKAATLANTIMGNAEKGSRQMNEMMSAVKEINDASQSINKVIKVIDDIAFQTNILALNAAVEAARAGQHGKGFAVVAEEVRNLAAKSAEAAKDTGGLIANSMEKAELGARIANETATSLAEIVSGINESTQLVGDIAKSSEEQSGGIAQINKGIDQVAQVIQQNSATAEESAAASEEMSSQSDMLQGLVAQFKLKNNGSSSGRLAASHSAPPPRQLTMPEKKSYNPPAGGGDFGKY